MSVTFLTNHDRDEINESIEQLSAKTAPECKYELLSSVTVGVGGTNEVEFPDVSDLSAVMACITMPVSELLVGTFLSARITESTTYVVGGNYGSKEGVFSIRLEIFVDKGILTGSAQGNVRGWGSGDLYGLNDSGRVVFAEKIKGVQIYCPNADRSIPEGTVIELYGVRA